MKAKIFRPDGTRVEIEEGSAEDILRLMPVAPECTCSRTTPYCQKHRWWMPYFWYGSGSVTGSNTVLGGPLPGEPQMSGWPNPQNPNGTASQ